MFRWDVSGRHNAVPLLWRDIVRDIVRNPKLNTGMRVFDLASCPAGKGHIPSYTIPTGI